MKDVKLSRRRLLGTAAITGAAVAVIRPGGAAQAAPAAGGARPWRDSTSANGWPVLEETAWHPIEGSGQRVKLAAGDAAVLLTHVARRFHYEIDQLRPGDVHGHTGDSTVHEPYESNHLSGSAIAIRPHAYPAGVRGGLYPAELVVVRDILAELDGAVVWGGDFDRPKESHFEIAYPPGHRTVRSAARKVLGWRNGPGGEGAGAVDAFDPSRRSKARSFERRPR
ncbi:hypothetical protein [Actinoplanes teichomyceticus]|uniref:D-alanyl-D-alanine carboxypeptidase-like protein n=1 Tax=Actinoplanes teichomyceticus TaxID=1867 RepID=A0A561VIB9_ACTTI|nr:hypothetical protein [Actinoplanes teichomyceticus]TWG11368.1 hypothetical protein FHX34_10698 [Actinoplanes teichomyceticus]